MAKIQGSPATFQAAEALEFNRRVKLSSASTTSPYEVEYADADDKGIGVTLAVGNKANGNYASGDPVSVHLFSQAGTHKIETSVTFTAGDKLYGADDGKITNVATGGPGLFTALEDAGATDSICEALWIGGTKSSGLIHSEVAASSAVTNTTTETSMYTRTIDGANLEAGDVLEIKAAVDVPATNSTDTLTLKLYIGTEVIATSGAVDVADDDVGYFDYQIVIGVGGASGTMRGQGLQLLDATPTTTPTLVVLSTVSEDLSGDVVIKLTAQWSVASASNSATARSFTIKHLKQ